MCGDEGYPAFVACKFTDAHRITQIFNDSEVIEKIKSI